MRAPFRFTLRNAAGLELQLMDWGATWLSLSLPLPGGERRELLLGCGDFAGYQRQSCYLGAAIGRFANRLRDARFNLDGVEHRLLPNEGPNQLHGGPQGFDRRPWHAEQQDERSLTLKLVSPDGDQGFPGELQARVRYTLEEGLALRFEFEAVCSLPCPVSLTQHPYFNLDGDRGGDTGICLDHSLRVDAAHWLPIDTDDLPASELAHVQGTGLDLRSARRLADAIAADAHLQAHHGFNHSLAFTPAPAGHVRPVAELASGDGRVRLHWHSDQPALQVYTGQRLAGVPARDGRPYCAYAGIALEPQFLPGSPQRPAAPPLWPDCVLRPGQVWRGSNRLVFAVA